MYIYYKTLEQIWADVNAGHTIYWSNTAYKLTVENDPVPEKHLFSEREGRMLRATCTANYFGSRLHETDISNCFRIERVNIV